MENLTETNGGVWYEKVVFSWYDYILFAAMLLVSMLIGIYFGFFDKKQSSANEYLLGGKKMKVFPIAMSLIASHVSGLTILGVPSDVYKYGSGYGLSFMALTIVCILTCYVYLPVFYKLQLTSTYEYLKLRFDMRVRIIASFLFAFSLILFLSIVIYTPALAFSQVTGINLHYITPVVCGVCIFYTTIGGLKAVVWTDTLQFSVTVSAMCVVFYMGTVSAGGVKSVIEKTYAGGRMDIDFDWDPTKKDTFWAMLIGFTINYIPHLSIHHGCIQKFLSLPSLRDANLSVIAFGIGIILVKSTCVLTGWIIYAKYYDCDPLITGKITKYDQLVPYYVMDVVGNIPGLPGLFIAGVFCTALSTLSAALNTLSGTIYEDFISRFMPKDITQKTVSNILKLLVVLIGIVSTSLVFIVEHFDELLPLAIKFSSITSGPLLGLFTLGMFFPKANAHGAFYGGIASFCTAFWILFRSQWYIMTGAIVFAKKTISVESCDLHYIPQINSTIVDEPEPVFFLYRLSFYYNTLVGTTVCIVVGLIISHFTRTDDFTVHKDLLSPLVHHLVEDSPNSDEYLTLQKAANVVVVNDK